MNQTNLNIYKEKQDVYMLVDNYIIWDLLGNSSGQLFRPSLWYDIFLSKNNKLIWSITFSPDMWEFKSVTGVHEFDFT